MEKKNGVSIEVDGKRYHFVVSLQQKEQILKDRKYATDFYARLVAHVKEKFGSQIASQPLVENVQAGNVIQANGSEPNETEAVFPSSSVNSPSTRPCDQNVHGSCETGKGPSEKNRCGSERGSGVGVRGRGVSERGRGVSERGRGVSERGRGASERARGASERARGVSERARGGGKRGRGRGERGRGARVNQRGRGVGANGRGVGAIGRGVGAIGRGVGERGRDVGLRGGRGATGRIRSISEEILDENERNHEDFIGIAEDDNPGFFNGNEENDYIESHEEYDGGNEDADEAHADEEHAEEEHAEEVDAEEVDGIAFTHERVLLLLDTYGKFQARMENGRQKKYKIWRLIAAEMSKKGFNGVTGRMCEVKFKNLKTRFKIIKTRNGQTGNGRGPTWPYYDKMDDLFRNDVAVNPNNIVEAGAAGFNRIRRRANFVRQIDDEDEDDGDPINAPVNKRKRISNAETIELMMRAEAERAEVNTEMLEILNGIRQQGNAKVDLMKRLIDEKFLNH